jgi:hypothetical protein
MNKFNQGSHKGFNASIPQSTPSRFQLHDGVIYTDHTDTSFQGVVVKVDIQLIKLINQYSARTTYDVEIGSRLITDIAECDLMSLEDWKSKLFQQHWNTAMAKKSDWLTPVYDPATPEGPRCECGAHKVKESAHAQWCDMSKVGMGL